MSSRLSIPAPNTFTHKRPTSKIVNGRKVPGTPTTVESSVPGLMSPGGTLVEGTTLGTVEIMRDTIFLEAVDDDGTTRVVRAGDLLIDETTGEVWRAHMAPGNTFPNPSLFGIDNDNKHHIEFPVERIDPENLVLA